MAQVMVESQTAGSVGFCGKGDGRILVCFHIILKPRANLCCLSWKERRLNWISSSCDLGQGGHARPKAGLAWASVA